MRLPVMIVAGTCCRCSPALAGSPSEISSGSGCRPRWAILKRCWSGCRLAPNDRSRWSGRKGATPRHPMCNSTMWDRWPTPPRSSACSIKVRSGWCSATADHESNSWPFHCGSTASTLLSHIVRSALMSVGRQKKHFPSVRTASLWQQVRWNLDSMSVISTG